MVTAKRPQVFGALRAIRRFERRHFRFLRTIEDCHIVYEIGHWEEVGSPIELDQLYRSDIGSVATVRRRLRRLRDAGAVVAARAPDDARVIVLKLGPAMRGKCVRYPVANGEHVSPLAGDDASL